MFPNLIGIIIICNLHHGCPLGCPVGDFIDRWSDNIGLDRDRFAILALSTILLHFTHNEIQWPTAARRWQFALQDVSRRQSCHLSTPNHPRVPPVWPYCRQAQCGRWRSLKWIIADLLTSSHPHMSASHLLGLQVRANEPSLVNLIIKELTFGKLLSFWP